MELEKLKKEDFTADVVVRGEPGIRFGKTGLIAINKSAVKHLKLYDEKNNKFYGVSFLQDTKHNGDLYIMRDDNGWELRGTNKEGVCIAVFNNTALCHHVIDVTWDHYTSHPLGAEKPCSYHFCIAIMPADDGKNKNVFALLRKKE